MYTLCLNESFQQNERNFSRLIFENNTLYSPRDKINVKEQVGMCENVLYLFPKDIWFQSRPSCQLS